MSSKEHPDHEIKRKRSIKKDTSPPRGGGGDVKRSKSATNVISYGPVILAIFF